MEDLFAIIGGIVVFLLVVFGLAYFLDNHSADTYCRRMGGTPMYTTSGYMNCYKTNYLNLNILK